MVQRRIKGGVYIKKCMHIRSDLRFLLLYILLVVITAASSSAQTLGGSSAYAFLKLPAAPILTAAGGVNTSYTTNDAGFAMNNPALLKSTMHGQLSTSFNAFLAGVQAYSVAGAWCHQPSQTTFGANVFFINYGDVTATDASGNSNGNFHPVDYAVQLSAAKKYLQKWSYGASVRFIHSGYQQYRSSAVALDAGVLYADSARFFSASILAKNMGMVVKSYAGIAEELPFDLQIGVTKKLAKAPLSFSVTAHHLHQFLLTYNDTVFNRDNNFSDLHSTLNSIFNHVVVATHLSLGNHLEATIGYNYLRRSELNIGSSGNGINGFSAGFTAIFKKLQLQYARAYYQKNIAYNQFGLILQLNEFSGLGSL